MDEIIRRLRDEETLPERELRRLLSACDALSLHLLSEQAQEVRQLHYGRKVYIRGLIELTNICCNDCYYCGIRRSNRAVLRYRLSHEQIIECCAHGYSLGFRTFVLQGGEDPYWTADRLVRLIGEIRQGYPDCAITLSLGEWDRGDYERFFAAGANRFLLRHETFDPEHYARLHPEGMSAEHRQQCLRVLREIGFQTGTGVMVGSPGQTIDHLIQDIRFIEEFRPQMIGLGPFLPHKQTPFAAERAGSLELTLRLLSILRLMHPRALIPSTTALATLHPEGRLRGILAGCNVVMPNLSPAEQRKKYELYNDKAALGAEAAEGLHLLSQQLESIGYELSFERGDSPY
ncbi:[FeFe] hydrogenase H-cluster radical SAM maturase HydE [Porphyromonas sp. COT-239 OH1446]|uniref:[FeFe] hydrogenase H-cluster radical SAM maturase HydE n=1 Tax=Porphyromonas sp. COT-239 OH1446 TaxID=1515613 RepID=UPI00052D9617|nr:[FeFe] hydrogenase H-cluster radical SAM maturase HydE [Porphyromonas sp. COT-239 OH1446]KGN71289.1 biotin synthase [Porphyromonas sp. COT-239 OH1446]